MILFKVPTRMLAFVGKEIVETLRRPGALFSLVLGPFIILAVFGVGYSGFKRPLDTIIVIPPSSGLSQNQSDYEAFGTRGIRIVGVTSDGAAASQELANQQVDLIVTAPSDLEAAFKAGHQSTVQVQYNLTDPVQANYAGFLAENLGAQINREIIKRAAQQGEQQAVSIGVSGASIPPDVIAAPTKVDAHDIAPTDPGVIPFFGLAVLALILQHMAVTLTSLSLVRERLGGVMELFRIAPVTALEIVIGKYVAFGVISALIAGAILGMLLGLFQVPVLGPPVVIAGVLGLLVFASLGLGLFISVISDSERQAVQISLLVLLASVFFSGFVINIDEFIPAVRTAAYAIPVTHGIRLIQDLLLRGGTTAGWEIGALAAIGVVLFGLTWMGMRRAMQRA